MSTLETLAAWAEILGVCTIFGGAIFAALQIVEYRRRRRAQIAADLCRSFSEPNLARAVALIRQLPDGADAREVESRGIEYEEAAQVVGMVFETMGLLVYRRIASFAMIQSLAGGLLLMMWRKLEGWIVETRREESNPRFGEWMQWLAERIGEQEASMVPAYEAHTDWQS